MYRRLKLVMYTIQGIFLSNSNLLIKINFYPCKLMRTDRKYTKCHVCDYHYWLRDDDIWRAKRRRLINLGLARSYIGHFQMGKEKLITHTYTYISNFK